MMEQYFKNGMSMIGVMSLVLMSGSMFFTKGAVQNMYLYFVIMLVLLGVTCGMIIPIIHDKYVEENTWKPVVISGIIAFALAFITRRLTESLFDIQLNLILYIFQFVGVFVLIYIVLYAINAYRANKINRLIKERK